MRTSTASQNREPKRPANGKTAPGEIDMSLVGPVVAQRTRRARYRLWGAEGLLSMPRAYGAAVAVCSCSVIATTALANSGTALPLDQYQAGTEHTNAAIVANGSFETVMGGQPAGWTLGGRIGVGAPTGPNLSLIHI